MSVVTAKWAGAVCDMTKGAHGVPKNASGCLFTRNFASGTKVAVGQYLSPDHPTRPSNRGKCIYWSDGSITTDNATRCMPKDDF
eukprot:COSAG02_NODE_469_length_21727_cov_64.506334_5_plen_84_part_00